MSTTSRVPQYRHHRARGLAVVRINGRDHYLGPWKSKASYAEYDRLIGEWLARGRVLAPADAHDAGLAVVEIIAGYLRHAREYYQKHGKPTREFEMIKEAASVLKRLYGTTDAVSFGPVALRVVREAMVEKGWTRKYINKQVGRIVRMFKWAASLELVPASVHQSLSTLDGLKAGRTTATDRPPVEPVDDATVERTLPHLPPVVADMVRFQRLTGARPGEVCELRPCDVDRSQNPWRYKPASHKTEHHGKRRAIFVGPQAQAILTPYLLRPADVYCFSPAETDRKRRDALSEARKTPLSCGNRRGTNRKTDPKRSPGDHYTNESYRRAIHRVCDQRHVPKWAPNQLRHAAATQIRSTFGLEAAQVVLGHAAVDVTQIYAERDMQLAARVASQIG